MAKAEVDLTAEGTAQLLTFARQMAREAGGMIRRAFATKPMDDYGRKSMTDPVTETDRAVEAYLFGSIRERYPAHAFIGEESAADCEWTGKPTWIIDPIDGTANCTFVGFVRGGKGVWCCADWYYVLLVCVLFVVT